jgi:hypothetical protein
MIDPTKESILAARKATRLPEYLDDGKPSHESRVKRHILKGVKTPAGVVKLDGFRQAGRLMTSREAVRRFFNAINAANGASPLPATDHADAHRSADRRLAAAGL